ncbi:NAD-dependent epimerase/dehydratase family protein [Luteolibacter luteus]|uniref:NAD-dependent epimerase/dehydratase family protein n=1 Tax=Luteolibacter luteus TaxID=2728835 RepID=A0A858RJR9_9BACT|nr:NAD-dependent epimerase/dehydratase family protein [Luteolibacter luteus]QJE97516.1 NAD-dependent epimerase/dehydratase family protein [Luteolibacter luteus]
MPTLLLCGHGYLGQAISRDFITGGWDVTAISREGDPDATPPEVSCDLSSAEQVAALNVSPDFIVHCASSGRGGADAYRAVYLEGCRYLLQRFPGIPLLFTSSTSVYAQTDGSEVTEESLADPDRETGKILRETEELVLSHGGIVTRLAGIYGPQRSVILKKFLRGESVIEEDGRRYLNQIHRDDAASAVFHLAWTAAGRKSSEIYNIADSNPLSQLDCFKRLSELFLRPLPSSGPRDPDRKRGWTHKRVSNAKLRATGWQPAYPSFPDAAPGIAKDLDLS